jgi:hypothetical protein
MDCLALNKTDLLQYQKLENIDDTDWFFECMSLDEAPKNIGKLSVCTDIKRHPQLKDCYIYILCMTKDGCTIGDYDYTEYEYFKSKEDFNRACDEYKGSAEKCHKRYIEYMNNYHKHLLDEAI